MMNFEQAIAFVPSVARERVCQLLDRDSQFTVVELRANQFFVFQRRQSNGAPTALWSALLIYFTHLDAGTGWKIEVLVNNGDVGQVFDALQARFMP